MRSAWSALSNLPKGPGPAKTYSLVASAPPEERKDVVAAGHPSAAPADGSWIPHVVGPRDTVMGLALRYGCTEASICAANDLCSNGSLASLGVAATLRIPATRAPLPRLTTSGGESEASRIRRFIAAAKCGEAEARFYLSDAEYDVGKALAAYAKDDAFEKGGDTSGSGGGGMRQRL